MKKGGKLIFLLQAARLEFAVYQRGVEAPMNWLRLPEEPARPVSLRGGRVRAEVVSRPRKSRR
jgi:hypothetical protein